MAIAERVRPISDSNPDGSYPRVSDAETIIPLPGLPLAGVQTERNNELIIRPARGPDFLTIPRQGPLTTTSDNNPIATNQDYLKNGGSEATPTITPQSEPMRSTARKIAAISPEPEAETIPFVDIQEIYQSLVGLERLLVDQFGDFNQPNHLTTEHLIQALWHVPVNKDSRNQLGTLIFHVNDKFKSARKRIYTVVKDTKEQVGTRTIVDFDEKNIGFKTKGLFELNGTMIPLSGNQWRFVSLFGNLRQPETLTKEQLILKFWGTGISNLSQKEAAKVSYRFATFLSRLNKKLEPAKIRIELGNRDTGLYTIIPITNETTSEVNGKQLALTKGQNQFLSLFGDLDNPNRLTKEFILSHFWDITIDNKTSRKYSHRLFTFIREFNRVLKTAKVQIKLDGGFCTIIFLPTVEEVKKAIGEKSPAWTFDLQDKSTISLPSRFNFLNQVDEPIISTARTAALVPVVPARFLPPELSQNQCSGVKSLPVWIFELNSYLTKSDPDIPTFSEPLAAEKVTLLASTQIASLSEYFARFPCSPELIAVVSKLGGFELLLMEQFDLYQPKQINTRTLITTLWQVEQNRSTRKRLSELVRRVNNKLQGTGRRIRLVIAEEPGKEAAMTLVSVQEEPVSKEDEEVKGPPRTLAQLLAETKHAEPRATTPDEFRFLVLHNTGTRLREPYLLTPEFIEKFFGPGRRPPPEVVAVQQISLIELANVPLEVFALNIWKDFMAFVLKSEKFGQGQALNPLKDLSREDQKLLGGINNLANPAYMEALAIGFMGVYETTISEVLNKQWLTPEEKIIAFWARQTNSSEKLDLFRQQVRKYFNIQEKRTTRRNRLSA